MDKRVLKYDKSTNERELYPAHSSSTGTPYNYRYDSPIVTDKELPLSYIKTDGVLSYHTICVISGGTTRERDFLVEFEKKKTFKKINLIFITSDKGKGGLTPNMMLKEYKKIYADGRISIKNHSIQLEKGDKVYMITDVDHYEKELKIILKDYKENGIPIWIISNPCFEIWIYYCYRNNPKVDLQNIFNVKPSLRSSELKNINGTFNNGGGLNPKKAFQYLKNGITNSSAFYSEKNGMPELLSTQMHIFATDVLELLGSEYNTWLEKLEKSRIQFRKKN